MKLEASSSTISVHALGDELIIFDPRSNATNRLNATAAAIWRCWREEPDVDRAAMRLHQMFEVEYQTARECVLAMVKQFQELGLVG